MSRLGGFVTYWTERERLLLEGAEPVDSVAATAIPMNKPVQVEVVTVETVGGFTMTVRDGSGRTHRVDWRWGLEFPPKVGDIGRFTRKLSADSPQLVKLKAEPGFALVRHGEILKISNRADALRAEVLETFTFERGPRKG